MQLSLREIRVGAVCQSDILGPGGILLHSAGRPLSQSVYDQLVGRGIENLEVDPEDIDALRGIKKPKSKVGRTKTGTRQNNAAPKRPNTTDRFRPEKITEIASSFRKVRDTLNQMVGMMDELNLRFVKQVTELAPEVVSTMRDDADLALFIASHPTRSASLIQRSAEMSVVATGIALELGFSEEHVIHVAMAGLLHDIGLYRQPKHFRDSSQRLTSGERWEYKRHPLIAADMLSEWTSIPDAVCAIVAQVHERQDGSGFPRGLPQHVIQPGAAILGLVDSYLTLTGPGPGRPAVVPHDAMGCLLHLASQKIFVPEHVRAFLNQMSLYPIGSRVKLDDGSVARVIRRDGDLYATPVVETVENDAGISPNQIIELKLGERTILHPVVDAKKPQMRVEADLMPSLSLEFLEADFA